MEKIKFVDTTLRDGEQTPGVVFSEIEKIVLAQKIDLLKIDIIEVGIPVIGKEERAVIKKIIDLNLGAEILLWNRMKIEDIDLSLTCGAKNIHLSAPVSNIQLKVKLKKEKSKLLAEMTEAIKYAKDAGCLVSIGAEDASRAEKDFLFEYLKTAEKAGAERFRYADTVGILDPFSTVNKLKEIRYKTGMEIEFHAHNDFGMAVANSLAACRAEVDYISSTITGIGERAGNTDFKEFVDAYNYFFEHQLDFDWKIYQDFLKKMKAAL
ncbi:homocitrate synthase NifV [Halanaerobium saccharolyticum]|uniref:Homocitrate synthase NifV n=1 Tax=Halanaerobium saccharolyticum TaxID=43595 RepID=A0A4R7Z7M3_9FIRM|nr:homocitrate synthase [Halanaerobium saccharolyticum]RAK11797.1 homocitrate synthase NifV [Halanaerobium saccharolyticum]TDW07638.1 homocitrate synthase NifV [Halanaerobium saccharolyticum]TDX64559.1 homocitrate synthase NifV [Halanaerobium saccharolyticum]